MDNETLRKQLFEEIQEDFRAKLREAKRQKIEAEEELETGSERWKAERRRLNTEIDRLQIELDEVVSSKEKTPVDTKPAADPQEIARLQEAAVKAASAGWEAERVRLTSQISKLERAVAEAIERSSNPMRWTQPLKEQYEAKLTEATKQRFELERQILRMKAEWDEEKKKLITETLKMRRLVPKGMENINPDKLKGRPETFEEKRIHELDDQLTASHADVQKYHQDAAIAQEEVRSLLAGARIREAENQQLHDQVNELQEILVQSRSNSQEPEKTAQTAEIEKALKEMVRAKESLEADLARQREEWSEERRQLRVEVQQLERTGAAAATASTAEPGADNAETRQEIASLEQHVRKLETEKAAMETRGKQRETELKEAVQNLEESSRERQLAIDRLQERMEEWTREREVLQAQAKQHQQSLPETNEDVRTVSVGQLRTATSTAHSDRNALTEEAGKSQTAAAGNGAHDASNPAAVEAEIARVEKIIRAITALTEDPGTDLSTIIRKNVEKSELEAYLKGVSFSVGRGAGID